MSAKNINYCPGSIAANDRLLRRMADHQFSVTFVRSVILLYLLNVSFSVHAQLNTDNAYTKPLKEVLTDIEKRYGVKIKYADSIVVNKNIPYAEWRYRNDVETTLDNVLRPFDMKVKKEKDKQYKLSYYEYYRWNVEEGWAELDRIASASSEPSPIPAMAVTRLVIRSFGPQPSSIPPEE